MGQWRARRCDTRIKRDHQQGGRDWNGICPLGSIPVQMLSPGLGSSASDIDSVGIRRPEGSGRKTTGQCSNREHDHQHAPQRAESQSRLVSRRHRQNLIDIIALQARATPWTLVTPGFQAGRWREQGVWLPNKINDLCLRIKDRLLLWHHRERSRRSCHARKTTPIQKHLQCL